MKSSWVVVCASFFLISIGIVQTKVMAQPPKSVGLAFEQTTNDGINVSYGIRVNAPQLYFTALPGQLIAPDGTAFTLQNSSVSNLTFTDIGNRFFGNWTIAERAFTGNSQHTFSLNSFSLSNVFAEIPRIVEPFPSGQSGIAGTSFNLAWNYASGAMPSGNTVTSSNTNGTIAFSNLTMNTAQATATLNAGASQANFTISAGSFSPLNNFAGNVIQDPSGLGSTWTRDVSFRSLSQPIQVTVVPEPSSMAMLGLGCLGLFVRRSRRWLRSSVK